MTQTTNRLLWLATSTTAVLLAACGGGGSAPPMAPATKAEGVYSGNITGSTSGAFQLLVLENDEYWGWYGLSSSSGLLVAGFLQGQGASNDGSFTSSNLKDFGAVPPTSGTATAIYVVNTSTSGTAVTTAGSATFSGSRFVGSAYDYNAAATVSTIAGSWTLAALHGSGVALTIAADGAFSGTSAGCSFMGTLTPRPSGKNVFNLVLTFGAAPCARPNDTATGVALTYFLSGGTRRELIMAVVNVARTSGTAFFGTR